MPMDVEFSGQKGPEGPCSARLTKETIKITAETGEVYTIALDHLGRGIKAVAGDALFFRLNRTEDWLYQLNPYSGTYILEFTGFRRTWNRDLEREEKLPTTWTMRGGMRRGRGGGRYRAADRTMFTAEFLIIGGEFDGVKLSKALDYLWEPGADGEAKLRAAGDRGTRVYDLLKALNFDFANDGVEYSPNILPALEKILLAKKQYVTGVIEDGFLATLAPLGDGIVVPKRKVSGKPGAKKGSKSK